MNGCGSADSGLYSCIDHIGRTTDWAQARAAGTVLIPRYIIALVHSPRPQRGEPSQSHKRLRLPWRLTHLLRRVPYFVTGVARRHRLPLDTKLSAATCLILRLVYSPTETLLEQTSLGKASSPRFEASECSCSKPSLRATAEGTQRPRALRLGALPRQALRGKARRRAGHFPFFAVQSLGNCGRQGKAPGGPSSLLCSSEFG